MARVCCLTGKRTSTGHNVSHSVRRTKRTFKPNIQKRRILINGNFQTVKISTRGLRTLAKKGAELK